MTEDDHKANEIAKAFAPLVRPRKRISAEARANAMERQRIYDAYCNAQAGKVQTVMEDNIPHTPWYIRPRPTDSGLAVIENGTDAGSHIAECEWHIAEFIVQTVNLAHQAPD